MKLKLVSALVAVVVGAVALLGARATGATRPPVSVTPGYVLVHPTAQLFAFVYNPTGRTLLVTGHLVDQTNFTASADPTVTLTPHTTGQLVWTCGPTINCGATPLFTSRSPKTAYTVRFLDATNVLQAVYAGQMKRV